MKHYPCLQHALDAGAKITLLDHRDLSNELTMDGHVVPPQHLLPQETNSVTRAIYREFYAALEAHDLLWKVIWLDGLRRERLLIGVQG